MYEEKEIKYKKRKQEKKRMPKTKIKIKERKMKKKKNNYFNSVWENINWKELGIKLSLLMIIMILILYTITRVNKLLQKENAFLDENIENILDGTFKYYQNNALPKNIGDSSSFLLEEMKNLNLISDIKDDQDKYCDYINSYIILTKTNVDEYRLKVYLKCHEKDKNVEKIITCQEDNCSIKK